MTTFQPRHDTLPLTEISVEKVRGDANPLGSYDPEGGISRRAAELHREILEAQNRMVGEAGGEGFMEAAYEAFAAGLHYDLLTRFARETNRAMLDLTAPDAISKAGIVLREKIGRDGDSKETQEKLAALESIERLFQDEFAEPTPGVLPGSSSD